MPPAALAAHALSMVAPARVMAGSVRGPRHIVDQLIEERAPHWVAMPIWPLVRPPLYRLLDYGKAVRLADALRPLSGADALKYVSDLLALKVNASGLERVPVTGRAVIILNHPTGVADGVAVYDALKAIRSDIIFFANADAFRVCAGFADVMIPVEWVEEKRTREKTRATLQRARDALEAERAVVVFPAGRLARRRRGVIADPPWAPSALSLAKKYAAPVVPAHLKGPHPTLFHFFDRFSPELRDITLFHELLNKRGDRYKLTVGRPVPPEQLEGESAALTERLKRHIERELPRDPEAPLA